MSHARDNLVWLGAVPDHWKVQRLRQILSPVSEKNHPDLPLLSVVREKGVIIRNVEDKEENHNYVPDDLSGYKLVKSGQFAMNKMKAWQGSYGVSRFNGIVSPAYFVFDILCDMNKDFFNRAIRSMVYINYFGQASDGIRVGQWDLSMQRMKEIPFLLPPRPEQDHIVRFLDWKVSTVNKLIALKRKQITLLEEHKASVLNTTVTRGIQLNRSLKYSGLKWLPKVPEHWKIVPAKALFSNKRELRHDKDKMMAATQKYGMISQKKYMELEGRKIVLANDNLDKWLHVEPDDFIISLRSFQGGIERCIEAGCVTWHYVVLRPNGEVVPAFYRWFFKSPAYISALQHTSDFIRDGQDLCYSNFVKVRLLKIPLAEQIEIAEYLDKIMPRYDAAIIKREEEIQTLCEFRSRLISDVVTGNIDVRDIEVPDSEYVQETGDSSDEDNNDMGNASEDGEE